MRRDISRSIRSGHPWVWRESLAASSGLPPGAVVDVVDPAGGFVARGLWDPASPIALRVLTLDPSESVDRGLVLDRFRRAAALREGVLDVAVTNAWRVVHGEADRLPGIVCDRYAGVAVLRFDGDGPAALRTWAVQAALELPGVVTVVERRFRRETAGDDSCRGRVLAGPPPPRPLVVRENGMLLEADVLAGQKTGLFLDQRENRALVRSLARGRRVLDLFAYTGGFSTAAAIGGAAAITAVDLSRRAIEAARRNLALNGAGPDRALVAADVFAFLARAVRSGRRWDLVVVDPPSFAPSRAAVGRAVESYRRLNAAALRAVAPGGLLLTCSCSSHVGAEVFLRAIRSAASDAGVRVRIVEVRGAGPDHPVVPFFPEGRYLKAVLIDVAAASRRR